MTGDEGLQWDCEPMAGGQGRPAPDVDGMAERDLLRLLIGVVLICLIAWALILTTDLGQKKGPTGRSGEAETEAYQGDMP